MMHEQHHDGTCEEEQIRQHAEQMRPMLGEQEESGHGPKPNAANPPAVRQNGEPGGCFMSMSGVFLAFRRQFRVFGAGGDI
jgi:hypothetical protein